MVFPRYEPGNGWTVEPVSAAAALHELATNTMNLGAVGRRGFDALARMVRGVRSYRLTFSHLDDACGVLGELCSEA